MAPLSAPWVIAELRAATWAKQEDAGEVESQEGAER